MKTIKPNSKKGLTLVETMLSVTLFAVVAIFFVSVFAYCAGSLKIMQKLKQGSNKAAGGIEVQQNAATIVTSPDYTVSTSSGNFSINFGGTVISSGGSYIDSKNSSAEYKDYAPTP